MSFKTLFVGVDVSKLKHDVAAVDESKNLIVRPFVVKDSYDGYRQLLTKLKEATEKNGATEVYIGMESTGDYWKNLYYFLKRQPENFTVSVVNPVRTKAYAKTELRRAKTDAVNARDIACFMAEKRPAASVDRPAEFENLRDIDKRIHQLKKQSTMLINKLRIELSKVAPEIEKSVPKFQGRQILALLAKCPTAEAIDKASFEELALIGYGPKNRALSRPFIEKMKTLARGSIAYKKGPGSGYVVQSVVRSIVHFQHEINKLKKQAVDIYQTMKNTDSLLATIPGVSKETGLLLESYIGNVDRFSNSKQIVAYFGMNPYVDHSGKRKRKSFLEKKGDPMVRHKLFMIVLFMIGKRAPIIYPYYRRLVDSGKPKLVAIGAAMRKTLTIIYAMLKNNETFDPNKF